MLSSVLLSLMSFLPTSELIRIGVPITTKITLLPSFCDRFKWITVLKSTCPVRPWPPDKAYPANNSNITIASMGITKRFNQETIGFLAMITPPYGCSRICTSAVNIGFSLSSVATFCLPFNTQSIFDYLIEFPILLFSF